MSEQRTFRSKDNAFCLYAGTVVSAVGNPIKPMKRRAGSKKDFEAARLGVFATTGSPLTPLLTAEFGLK